MFLLITRVYAQNSGEKDVVTMKQSTGPVFRDGCIAPSVLSSYRQIVLVLETRVTDALDQDAPGKPYGAGERWACPCPPSRSFWMSGLAT